MPSPKYGPLKWSPANGPNDDDSSDYGDALPRMGKSQSIWVFIYTLLAVLSFSITMNIMLLAKSHAGSVRQGAPSFAGLEWDTPVTMIDDYWNIDDPIWDAPELQWHVGYLALNHDAAEATGVRAAQNWPWDASKGIYIVKAFHSMHCLFLLRDVIRRYRNGEEQLWSYEHTDHCLGTIRDDIKCMADDTLQYTGGTHTHGNTTEFFAPGVGDSRMCRDWNKLYQFSLENTACYYRPETYFIPILDRYKHCPDGSQPWHGKETLDIQQQ